MSAIPRLAPKLSTSSLSAPSSARTILSSYYHGASNNRNASASFAPEVTLKLRRSLLTSHPAIPSNTHSQVRYHRTDYEGPGKYGERETGSMFGEHDHSHSHEHEQQHMDVVNEDEKLQIRQLLQARYNRRSGTYSHRGYTIGIGGPGKIYFRFCIIILLLSYIALFIDKESNECIHSTISPVKIQLARAKPR